MQRTYDEAVNCTSATSPNGRVMRWTYDEAGNCTSETTTYPDGRAWRYAWTYDKAGNRTSEKCERS